MGSIVFYVFAVIFLAIAAYLIYYSYEYIGQYEAQAGAAVPTKDAINLYITNSVPYFAYAVISYGIGLVMQKVGELTGALSICVEEAVEEDFEELSDLKEAVEAE